MVLEVWETAALSSELRGRQVAGTPYFFRRRDASPCRWIRTAPAGRGEGRRAAVRRRIPQRCLNAVGDALVEHRGTGKDMRTLALASALLPAIVCAAPPRADAAPLDP